MPVSPRVRGRGRSLRIYLVRHGQSQWQLTPGDDLDMPLSPLGHEQAALLADWCARRAPLDADVRFDFGALCTSPLQRARQTAGHVAAALGVDLSTRPGLCEAPFRVVDELPRAGTPLEVPVGDVTDRYRQFRRQVRGALAELVESAVDDDRPVLAVTHGGVIKTVLRIIAGTDVFCARLYNCGITAVDWKDGIWRVAHVNLWDHLPPALRTT
ncbi:MULTISPECIES: histidine phosphatase family protein [unclassified Streptomyces]|jgi:broad specificity phosphatase PhoE|uniref:histidine phosphatase family protein n=1 Tax=unclassified Streptomyces TaxID=2593676 RepID=UPI0036F72444